MRTGQGLLFLITIIGLTACATTKPPEMVGTQPAGAGISVGIHSALQNQKPNAAYFVKLSNRDNVLSMYPVIRSNYTNGYNAYLLNAEPGLYAVVAASYSQFMPAWGGRIDRVAYFTEDLIRKTVVEVKPGAISYMGTYEVDMAFMAGFRSADKAQEHYRSQMQTEWWSNFQSTEKTSVRDSVSEMEFFQKAREDFSESGWLLLASYASVETPITRNNSQITFPHYSIVVPPDRWHLLRPNEKAEVAVITTKLDLGLGEPAIYRMQFARNEVLHEVPRSWSARQVADDFRNMEKQIMIEQGVRKGQYKLSDVVMGEDSVGDKTFYTMKYTASDNNVNQSASLYLYFPREEKNAYFMVIHYSETIPRGAAIVVPFRRDFLETLKSLRINE